MKKPTLTPEVFRSGVAKLRHYGVDSPSMRGAELVLCRGLTQAEAAHHIGCSVQTISKACRRVRAAILDEGMCPMCGRKDPPPKEGDYSRLLRGHRP